ncbi:MAG: hypothetical protein QOI20_781, partial [Acidimicrobiaceae bacterium]|nr:hypothetical protein [Acidimicrobiaceae bacterium]
ELPWRRDLPGRVDILYPTDKVIIEADSRRWHGRVDAMAEDRRRDREAQNHGYRVYRFLHEEVMYAPEVVCEAVRIALATSDRSVGSAA